MPYKPIQLVEEATFVARDSLLFVTCAGCDKHVAWQPLGGFRFHGQHCDWVYTAEPIDIDIKQFVIQSKKYTAKNVHPFKRKEKDKMVFA